jgi:predicted phage terminase large subunit-like protein
MLTKNELNEIWRLYPDAYAHKCSNGKFKLYKHIKLISELVVPEIAKGNARICISVPPRHGKSEFLSYWLPIWFLEMWPDKRIILASYAAELAQTFGRKIRDECATNELVKVKLSENSQASHRFDTNEKGGMIAVGVGGPITGKGAHLFLIDDPYKDFEEAMSQRQREKIQDWYQSVARTRLEPNGSMIVIMTRWHDKDLCGFLIKEHGFKEIKMPALAGENDILNRASGEALCLDRYTEKDFESIKHDIGSYKWNSLYQQNPIPLEGGLFKRKWWIPYKEAPNFTRIIQVWDCAQKVGISNDYSVCATWGQAHNGYYLLDIWRNKVEAPQLEQAAQNLFAKWRPNEIVIEDKSSGSSLIQNLRQKTLLPILAFDPKQRDKEVRASAVTPIVESGRCFIPESAPWLEDFLLEHERFPNAEHDDCVDTTSMALEHLSKQVVAPRIRFL